MVAADRDDPHGYTSGGTPPEHDPEADWPTNPGFPRPDLGAPDVSRFQVPGQAPARPAPNGPGLVLIGLVTVILGPFGAVPAAAAASTARRRGLPVLRYWVSFLVVWGVHMVALLLVVLSWLGGGFPAHSTSGAASTTAAASSAGPASAHSAAPSSSSSPAPSSPTSSAPASFPSSATTCSQNLAVNSVTSCQFATRTSDAYRAAGSPASTSLVVTSPVTNRSYTMACSAASTGLVTCSGGNNAVVYLR